MNVSYTENTKLVRGLDYYSDTVFEIKSDKLGAQSTVLAGGRYDKLLEIIGSANTPGIGFAAGIERIAMLIDENLIKKDEKKVFAVYFDETKDYFVKTINQLRKNGIKIDFEYNPKSFGAQMKKANKIKADYVIILGEDEEKENVITLKEFSTGNQEKNTIENIISKLLEKTKTGKG